jgi:hypothetical protein
MKLIEDPIIEKRIPERNEYKDPFSKIIKKRSF